MLSVITSIISSVLGLVLNKARQTAADKLKERGDVTDEKLRGVINDDLNDIKTKIDGLARKDLLTSYEFLKDGINTLNVALDEAKDGQGIIDETNTDQDGASKTTETTTRSESESGLLNEAIELSTAIQKLNKTSNSRLAQAKEYFKTAYEKATEAFCNEALNLPDKIMATKLRVASKIVLECLQDMKLAVCVCLLFLEKLHNLPAIGQTFSTYFKGGIKSWVYKDSRSEIVKSVLSLNFGVSELVARFSGELPNVRDWPRIHLPTRGETIHPLVIHDDVMREIFNDNELQPPENHVISTGLNVLGKYCINSKGELLVSDFDGIEVVSRSGEEKTFAGTPEKVWALVTDRNDNIFTISTRYTFECECDIASCIVFFCCRPCLDENDDEEYDLHVFDSSGNEEHECELDFLEPPIKDTLNFAVNNYIYIHKDWESFVHICDLKGNFTCRLSLEQNSSYRSGDFIRLECVTDDDDIVMRTRTNVLVYTKDGKLKRKIKVKNDIEAVAYNYVTSKIEVLVKMKFFFKKSIRYSIYSYSESDEVEYLYLPVKCGSTLGRRIKFCQHPAGSAALVIYKNEVPVERSIIFM